MTGSITTYAMHGTFVVVPMVYNEEAKNANLRMLDVAPGMNRRPAPLRTIEWRLFGQAAGTKAHSRIFPE